MCLGDDDVTTIHHHSHVNCVTCALPGGVILGCIWSRVWCVEASIADHCDSFWRVAEASLGNPEADNSVVTTFPGERCFTQYPPTTYQSNLF